jgi:hypothetical protein
MNRKVAERLDQIDSLFRSFQFETAHEEFLKMVEAFVTTAPAEVQQLVTQYLLIYEEALRQRDVVRLLDVMNYFLRPLLIQQ